MLPLKSSHTEQHAVVRFLWAKGRNATAVHSEMRPVYARGRESADDKKRLGRHVVVTINATFAAIDEFVRSD